ncbi:hypothetical protein EK904_012033, partial [Melospiza melodia maxima]
SLASDKQDRESWHLRNEKGANIAQQRTPVFLADLWGFTETLLPQQHLEPEAYQENPAAVLPDDFLLVRHISMRACDCDGTLERQKNIAPGNVAEWILQ